MRLEDTDELRSDEKFTQDIFAGLKWLGINWDEGPDIGGPYPPYRQTEKVDHYHSVARKLIESGHAYHCFCAPDELNQLKEEQKQANVAPGYDNRCRNITDEAVTKLTAEGRIPAIRFKVEQPRIVTWIDGIKGSISIDTSDLGGDMVIVKSNGMAIYNFAVVVDDIDMKMTQVIRGEDHIHNTAKQLLIYEALGVTPPEFAHTALIFDTERRKLSKRHHGELVHVDKYRQDGYMPEAIVNYLGHLLGGQRRAETAKSCTGAIPNAPLETVYNQRSSSVLLQQSQLYSLFLFRGFQPPEEGDPGKHWRILFVRQILDTQRASLP